MNRTKLLLGKRVLIVDDEPDILDTMEEILFMCEVDTVRDFTSAKEALEKNQYDIAVFDIMGVSGYELLEMANRMDIISVVVTAHALSPENFAKCMKLGARAYIPKEKMVDLEVILSDVIIGQKNQEDHLGRWFDRLKGYFVKKFGDPEWIKNTMNSE